MNIISPVRILKEAMRIMEEYVVITTEEDKEAIENNVQELQELINYFNNAGITKVNTRAE